MLPVISQPLVDARAETLSGADSDLNWDGAGRKLIRPTTATAVKAIRLPFTAGRLALAGRLMT